MSGSRLREWLAGAPLGLRWIEFEAYARRVFAAGAGDWYTDAARHAAAVSQAQSVIGTHCLSVDLTAPFAAIHAPGDAAAWAAALAATDTLAFGDQVLAALVHRYGGRLDLVLKLRCPADLLGAGSTSPDFDALDDVATALAGLLRRHAERPVSALVLEKSGAGEFSADEGDAYAPLVGVARHYGWHTALALPDVDSVPADLQDFDLDLLLLPRVAPTPASAAPRIGGGLDAARWAGEGGCELPAQALLHGIVPADARPETVLAVLASLP